MVAPGPVPAFNTLEVAFEYRQVQGWPAPGRLFPEFERDAIAIEGRNTTFGLRGGTEADFRPRPFLGSQARAKGLAV